MTQELTISRTADFGPRQTHGHLLVVDDEARNRMLLRDPLEARGFTVTEAEDVLMITALSERKERLLGRACHRRSHWAQKIRLRHLGRYSEPRLPIGIVR